VSSALYGDISFWEFIELSTEPAVINVDGNLASFLIGMVHHSRSLGGMRQGATSRLSRNRELRSILDIAHIDEEGEEKSAKSELASNLYAAMDHVATAAIAAKLRSRYLPPIQAAQLQKKKHPSDKVQVLSKRWHKYYIERLRISTTAAEISWSGALPIASKLPLLLRPALTFEGLPVLLRPFSQAHAYGTANDLLQSLKSHYLSIWRGFDLLVGVLANPAFIFRAFVFTWREAFSTGIGILSSKLAVSEGAVLKLISVRNTPPAEHAPWSSRLYRTFVLPVVNFQAVVLHGLVNFTSTWSGILHYNAASHRVTSGLVRSRNPRLFANVAGQDLLVGYVEGDNAGRALLSRVRMGAHLSEGYLCHIKGVHQVKSRPKHETDIDQSSHIMMLTFDRILLLSGRFNLSFCDVVWEVLFANLVHVSSTEAPDVPGCSLVHFWFMQNDPSSGVEDRQARPFVNDAGGLGALAIKEVFLPKTYLPLLFDNIKTINSHAVDMRVLSDPASQ